MKNMLIIIGSILLTSSCSENTVSDTQNTSSKKIYSSLEECVTSVGELDAKLGYPPRGEKGSIFYCESDRVEIIK
jgi:hypothetical protein